MELSSVLAKYDLGEILDIGKLSGGLINQTYKVSTEKGVFVAQRLSKIFNKNLMQDYKKITGHLKEQNFPAPDLVQTRDSGEYVVDDEGHIWRVLKYIDHDKPVGLNNALAFQMGKTLAQFHNVMSLLEYTPKFRLPDFHDTPKIVTKLNNIVSLDKYSNKVSSVLEEYEFIQTNIVKHYLPSNLPKTLIHGDPKFTNFLFKNDKVVAMIDLDTVMLGSELIDLGDALRSWCLKQPCDFEPQTFDAALEGYFSESHRKFAKEEIRGAVLLIVLELAARFLIDYFEENYFDWDKERYGSAAEHNLVRCKNLIRYYSNLHAGFQKD